MNKRTSYSLSALMIMGLVACQMPNTKSKAGYRPVSLQTVPNLMARQSRIKAQLKAKILAKGGNPTLAQYATLQDLKDKYKAHKAKPRASHPLQKHFSLSQSAEHPACNYDTMNVCDYQEVGWDDFYTALDEYEELYNAYANGEETTYCAYEELNYCRFDQDQGCHVEVSEMKFYGCGCEGGCGPSQNTGEPIMRVRMPGQPDTAPLVISPVNRDGINDLVKIEMKNLEGKDWVLKVKTPYAFQIYPDTETNPPEMAQEYILGQSSWEGSPTTFEWYGTRRVQHHLEGGVIFRDEFLQDGVVTLELTVDGQTLTQTVEIKHERRLELTSNVPSGQPQPNPFEFNPNSNGHFKDAFISVIAERAFEQWEIDILNSQGEVVFEKHGWKERFGFSNSNQQVYAYRVGLGSYGFDWRGVDNNGEPLPEGEYTVRLNGGELTQKVQLNQLSLYVLNNDKGPFSVFYPGAEGSEQATLKVIAPNSDPWLLEIKDKNKSTIWFARGQGNKEEPWFGKATNSQDFVPPGNYTVEISSNLGRKSKPLEIKEITPLPDDLELYYDPDIQRLLDSIEPRLAVMQRDVEILMAETKAAYPNAPDFQLQSLPDVTGFRIQQQQAPPPPPVDTAQFSEANSSDRSKASLDAQNDRIVTDVEILRQKVAWIKEVNSNFSTQSGSGASGRVSQANKIQQSFYGITTSGGCFNFYDNQANYKRKRDKQNDEYETRIKLSSAVALLDGELSIKGEVVDPPDNFDYQSLIPNFDGLINVFKTQVTNTGNQFEVLVTEFEFTDKFFEDPETDVKTLISSCSNKCISSNTLDMNWSDIETEAPPELSFTVKVTVVNSDGKEVTVNGDDFITQSVKKNGLCKRTHSISENSHVNINYSFTKNPNMKLISLSSSVVIRNQKNQRVFAKPYTIRVPLTGAFSKDKNIQNIKLTPIFMSYNYRWNWKANQFMSGQLVTTGNYKYRPEKATIRYVQLRPSKKRPIRIKRVITRASKPQEREFFGYNLKEMAEKTAKEKLKCGFKNPLLRTAALYRFESPPGNPVKLRDQGGHIYSEEQVSCSSYGASNPPITVAAPDRDNPLFAKIVFQDGSTDRKRYNDAERKIVELLGRAYQVSILKPNQPSSVNGRLIMYVDREVCPSCMRLPSQMNILFPNVEIAWFDSGGTCYDSTFKDPGIPPR